MMCLFRKILLTLAILLPTLQLSARVVPRQKAADAAESFFLANGKSRRSGALTLVGEKDEAGKRGFWAFNRRGGGFVVIAGDDSVEPILAYSLEGEFPPIEKMPENMAWWFSQLATQIEAIPDDVEPDFKTRVRWENPMPIRTKSAATLQHEVAVWDQGAPFNNNCPEWNSERCVTGCVATAGAILTRFFQWPEAGEGTVPGKNNGDAGASYPAHDLGSYDWANMPLDYGYGYNDTQAAAVATLMYDLGTIAQMNYTPKASSSNFQTMANGMKEYLKYDKAAYVASRSDFSDDDWIALMKDNLATGPILYSGSGAAGGHTFIMDGYDAENRFHCNWMLYI